MKVELDTFLKDFCFRYINENETERNELKKSVIEKINKTKDFTSIILSFIDAIRSTFPPIEDHKKIMYFLIDALVETGVYPPLTEKRKEHLNYYQLVEGWGSYWYIYSNPKNCPICDISLCDPNGPPFKLEIGIEIRGMYDGVLYYKCPKCEGTWGRDGKIGSPEEIIDRWNNG